MSCRVWWRAWCRGSRTDAPCRRRAFRCGRPLAAAAASPQRGSTVQAVVAVRLTEVRESLIGGLVTRPWSMNNVAQAWNACAGCGAAVRQVLGDYAVCTFPAPELAVRFALLARKAVGPDAGLELADDGTTVPIPPTSAVGIGLALGVVDGGTDGEHASLSGRGVAEAIALAGNGRASRLHDDGVGVRQAGWGTDGFLNEGIVASETFIRTVLERVRRRNQPVHVRGEGGMCGGVSDDFALAPVAGWWEVGEGLVASALVIDSSSGVGAAEVRVSAAAISSGTPATSLRRHSDAPLKPDARRLPVSHSCLRWVDKRYPIRPPPLARANRTTGITMVEWTNPQRRSSTVAEQRCARAGRRLVLPLRVHPRLEGRATVRPTTAVVGTLWGER